MNQNIDLTSGGLPTRTERTNLIVNYLPQEINEEKLLLLFLPFGEIESVYVAKDHKTGYSYGYGFVKYSSEEAAVQAIQFLDGIHVAGKRLKVTFARPSGESLKDTNLYIANLPPYFTSNELSLLFRPYGALIQVRLLRDKVTGKSRRIGFVRYSNRESAMCAIKALNGRRFALQREPLIIKVAKEYGKQKAAFYVGSQTVSLSSGNYVRIRLRQ